MKALILKDLYMMRKSFKLNIVFIAVFFSMTFFNFDGKEMLFLYFPCIICGTIPISLLGYDEQSRWQQYSAVMPYTRAQIVSSKYIIAIIIQAALTAAIVMVQVIKAIIEGALNIDNILIAALVSLIPTSIPAVAMPLIFKLGAEKGRIALVFVGSIAGAGTYFIIDALTLGTMVNISSPVYGISAIVICIVLFVLSWLLSIAAYKKREL